jgi:alcohol dehydrogenase (cytochrome c)
MTCLPTSKRCSSYWWLSWMLLLCAPMVPAQTGIGASWPTYNGDLSGRRYSSLQQIDRGNVKSLTLAWAYPTHGATLKGTPVVVNGILYLTAPDRVWAIDARTGIKIWEFHRPSQGDHIGQRGVAFYQDRVYFGTPDAHLFCLDARNGKQIWEVVVADVKFGYYLSVAPVVVKGRIIVGTSGDQTNIPHFLEAFDASTGAVVWRTDSLPKPGAPGSETWPNAKAMSHGGGPMWLSGTYDADLNLLYWGTGNPHPVLDGQGRQGDNLYTCSILALNPDTGAIVWYFQPSPHDTHDWDAVETPVLFDAEFAGKPRKLLAQASRNGYFFVLDRQTGKALLSKQFVPTNWALKVSENGEPVPNPAKEPQLDGALVEGASNGGTNWMPPSFDPESRLFYVSAQEGFSYWYLSLDENGEADDHQGGGSAPLISKSVLLAIDYQTGDIRWRRDGGSGRGSPGILTTAGHLLFTGDAEGNLLALDPDNGKALWHTRPGGTMSNGPMTYEIGGRQFVVTAADDMLYAWTLPGD